jgi:hypothetical protein
MSIITAPEPVLHSAVFNPVVWLHGGPTYFMIETSRKFYAAKQPMLRDADNKPLTLTEELGVGTIVRIAIGGDGLMAAIKIVELAWADPFAEAGVGKRLCEPIQVHLLHGRKAVAHDDGRHLAWRAIGEIMPTTERDTVFRLEFDVLTHCFPPHAKSPLVTLFVPMRRSSIQASREPAESAVRCRTVLSS